MPITAMEMSSSIKESPALYDGICALLDVIRAEISNQAFTNTDTTAFKVPPKRTFADDHPAQQSTKSVLGGLNGMELELHYSQITSQTERLLKLSTLA
ncbi:MAG: hypothetical protein Q8N34_01180 [Gammaproteobacteria bacterium]|nr:hypothetical protein [Gammaproteobacteria bacterium]